MANIVNYSVSYTNTAVSGAAVVSGTFTVSYDNSGVGVVNAVSLSSTDGTTFGYADIVNFSQNPSTGYYQLQLNTGGMFGTNTNIAYTELDPSNTTVSLDYSGTFYSSFGYADSGTLSDVSLLCYLSNTLISTPTGSTPVQDLQIGDLILNHLGQAVPVKWIGRQQIHPAFAGDNLPICIRQGALGNDLPLRDLYVSPGHALYIDNCLLIDAKALVNGTTITQVTQWEGDVQYLHIETEHHEIILAEGALAETYMDYNARKSFNNYSEYLELYPQAKEMVELDIPRVNHKRQLPNAVKAKLEAISEVLMGEDRIKEQMVG